MQRQPFDGPAYACAHPVPPAADRAWLRDRCYLLSTHFALKMVGGGYA